MSETRTLLVIHNLPERATAAERVATLRVDIRDARDLLQKKLEDASHRYTVSGWVADADGIRYEPTPGAQGIIATLRLTRGES